jgi:hypothetical protein
LRETYRHLLVLAPQVQAPDSQSCLEVPVQCFHEQKAGPEILVGYLKHAAEKAQIQRYSILSLL